MRILLPPSEAKRPGGRGKPLGQRASAGELAAARQPVLAALGALLAGPEAAAALLLPRSVAEAALADNARVLLARTLPAIERYAGVVYDGLSVDSLSPAARARADRELLIFSGLFGVVRGGDPVPAYRVPAAATLPGIGVLATYWKRQLGPVLPKLLDRGPILDLRSTDYAGMWQPAKASAEAGRLITARFLSPTPSGRLAVVSYNSKLAKGRLSAAVLEAEAAGRRLTGPADVAELWRELGGQTAQVRENALELTE